MDSLTDFLSQMHLATLEETPLHELALGSVDRLPSGDVTHGPWPAATCAAVLLAWHAADWLELYYRDPPAAWHMPAAEWRSRLSRNGILARTDAEDLLAHPERWDLDRADGHVCLTRSDTGDQQPWQRWHDLALPTAARLLG